MNLFELREWDKAHPNTYVKVIFKDDTEIIGRIYGIYPANPQHPSGLAEYKVDYFTFTNTVDETTKPYPISEIADLQLPPKG